MTIDWFLSAADQKVSSRSSIERKRWELASDDFYIIKEIFRVIMLYCDQYDHSTPLAQFRLYRKIVSPDKLDRFLPTTANIRKRFVTQEVGDDGTVMEVPNEEFIECCAKCVGLFKRVLDKEIDETRCLKELFKGTYEKCKEIKKEEKKRWFWETSYDALVDSMSKFTTAGDKGATLEEEREGKRIELTSNLCTLLSRLKAKQSVNWRLYTPAESSEDFDVPWANHTIDVESRFDVSPPVGIRLIVRAVRDDVEVTAQVKVCRQGSKLVVSTFKVVPMTNDEDPANHIAEAIVYNLLAEMLVQRGGRCDSVVIADSADVLAHDYVANHFGFNPPNARVMAKLGSYFAHGWTLSKDQAVSILEKSPSLLQCSSLDKPEGMNIRLNLDHVGEQKTANLCLRRDGEKLVVCKMEVNPPVQEIPSHDGGSADRGKRMESVVYQFIAELLLQRLAGCTVALFPHGSEVKLHGSIAKDHKLIPPDGESADEVIAWTLTLEGAKTLVGGRVTLPGHSGTLQLF